MPNSLSAAVMSMRKIVGRIGRLYRYLRADRYSRRY